MSPTSAPSAPGRGGRGRSDTKTWFFITDRRIRHELSLIDTHRVVLGKDRLAAELEDAGRVYDTNGSTGTRSMTSLFGLGERRYDALIDLLIQIRAPQLSKRPSEKLLSDALTESLTPVRRDLIEFVAEGMRGLDEERDQLQQLTDAHRSVLAFLGHYRAYAKVLVKRQAEGPRRNQSEHDRLGREIVGLTDQTTDIVAALTAASHELTSLQRQQAEREAEDEALRDSEFVELEAQLRSADDAASTAARRVQRAAVARQTAADALAEAEAVRTAERARTDQARARHAEALAAAQVAAAAARIEEEHAAVSGALPGEDTDPSRAGAEETDEPEHPMLRTMTIAARHCCAPTGTPPGCEFRMLASRSAGSRSFSRRWMPPMPSFERPGGNRTQRKPCWPPPAPSARPPTPTANGKPTGTSPMSKALSLPYRAHSRGGRFRRIRGLGAQPRGRKPAPCSAGRCRRRDTCPAARREGGCQRTPHRSDRPARCSRRRNCLAGTWRIRCAAAAAHTCARSG